MIFKTKEKKLSAFYVIQVASCAFLFLALASCNKDDDPDEYKLSDDIDNQAYVAELENKLSDLPKDAQVAIALVQDDNIEYLGITKDNDVLKSIDNEEKIFEIGSITKVFTSICLSELIASNEASLTETLQGQFDYQLKAGGDITFQQLANHTSGLPSLPTNVHEVEGIDFEDPYAIYSDQHLKSYLENYVELNNESGTTYEYSNLAVGLLAYSLAQKRNVTVEQLMKSIIFDPLNMTNTTTLLDNIESANLVEPRDSEGNVVSHWNFVDIFSGAGSIKSSVTDMVKFIQKNFEDDAVYDVPKVPTFERGENDYLGLGWIIYQDEEDTGFLHDGGTGGFSSILMLDKEKKTGVIVLSNVEGYHDAIIPLCGELLSQISE